MIVAEAPPLSAALAARRAGRARLPCWLAQASADGLGVERDVVACDPVCVVRGSALEALEQAWSAARAAWRGAGPGVPIGVGYLGYDLGRQLDRLREVERPPSGWPDLEFRFYDALWVRDLRGEARIWACDRAAADRLRDWLSISLSPVGGEGRGEGQDVGLGPLVSAEPPEQHVAAVRRVLEYLRAGDAYQVNLARRLVAPLAPSPAPLGLALFARLQQDSPAPHALWLADPAGATALVGNSPERFLRLDPATGRLETCPIKGTRPRGSDAALDARLAADLAASPKDRAEHVMIVDLERNDLGRVCETGSVAVADVARVVSLPTVHHLVTTVSGRLRPGVSFAQILRATFPGGSVTGAPKLRAMEIIDELEAARRGPYTGATGWLGAAGDLDLAIAIRTALAREGTLTLWVGGGIVADSIPEQELAETDAKAEAFSRLCSFRTLRDASRGAENG